MKLISSRFLMFSLLQATNAEEKKDKTIPEKHRDHLAAPWIMERGK